MTVLVLAPARARTRLPLSRAFLHAVRPAQWVKNVLVLAAPFAAGVVWRPAVLAACAVAALATTAVASGCYLVNDVQDRNLDRAHPTKRLRPVASGQLPVPVALVGAALLMVTGLVLAAAGALALLTVIGAYALLTLAYSAGLKAVPWLEVALVAAGFDLRALAGAAAAHVPVSPWFLVVVSAAAVLIVVSKRCSERLTVPEDPAAVRPVLRNYSDRGLRRVRLGVAAVLVLAYAGWVLTGPGGPAGVLAALSAGPVLAVVIRWNRQTDRGGTGAPEQVLVQDRTVRAGLLLWGLSFGASVLVSTFG